MLRFHIFGLQELAIEARQIMWALVGNNVAVLGAFLHCNLEDITSARRADAQHPKIFSGILVAFLLPLESDEPPFLSFSATF